MTDEEKSILGIKFAEILQLKQDHWKENTTYKTLWGNKTPLGIHDVILRLGETAKTGKFQ